jgi:hypothetical protein
MMTIEVLEQLAEDAKKYRADAQRSLKRNEHMNDLKSDDVPTQTQIDAVLVDFINFIGMCRAVDYAMYTKDLR